MHAVVPRFGVVEGRKSGINSKRLCLSHHSSTLGGAVAYLRLHLVPNGGHHSRTLAFALDRAHLLKLVVRKQEKLHQRGDEKSGGELREPARHRPFAVDVTDEHGLTCVLGSVCFFWAT